MTLRLLVLSLISLSSLLMAFLSAAAWMRAWSGARTGSFAGLSAAGLVYSACYLLELTSPDLATTLLVIRVEYFGIALIAPFFLLTVRDFSDDVRLRVPTPLLFVIPVVVIALVMTMGAHELYYIKPWIETVRGLTILHFDRGPGYWLQTIYLTLSIAYGVLIFIRYSFRAEETKRTQARFMLLGAIAPWIGNLLYLTKTLASGIDPTPICFSATGILFAVGFFRYHIFDLRPVARDTVFEQMRDAVLVTNDQGTVVDHNIAAAGIFPALGEKRLVRNVRELAPDSSAFAESMTRTDEDSIVALPNTEGLRRFALHHSTLTDSSGNSLGIAHVFMDVTERVFIEERLTTLASTDELTGTANRRSFFDRARAELERARRYGRPFGVAILDLNDFKKINDTYGHPAGDEALRLAARLCEEALRSADIMGRYGGDEFAFAFPECDEQGAQEAAERISRIVASAAFPYGEAVIQLSSSVGAAGASTPPLPDLEDLLKLADERMYQQKGRSRPHDESPD